MVNWHIRIGILRVQKLDRLAVGRPCSRRTIIGGYGAACMAKRQNPRLVHWRGYHRPADFRLVLHQASLVRHCPQTLERIIRYCANIEFLQPSFSSQIIALHVLVMIHFGSWSLSRMKHVSIDYVSKVLVAQEPNDFIDRHF